MNTRAFIARIGSVLVVSALLVGCGGPLKYAIRGTQKVPDADAKIVADVNKDAAMTKLMITAEHLAPPDRAGDGASTYVVWARSGDKGTWQRIGALAYDKGDRKGELKEASVPLTAFDLSITAEKKPAPESPSTDIVFSQRVE